MQVLSISIDQQPTYKEKFLTSDLLATAFVLLVSIPAQ